MAKHPIGSRFFVGFKQALVHPTFLGLSALFACFLFLFNLAQRLLYVFIDQAVFAGFAEGLVSVLALTALYDLVLYHLVAHQIVRFRLGLKIAFGVSWFLMAIGGAFILVFNAQAPENVYLYWKAFFNVLPIALFLFLLYFLIFEFPTWEKRWRIPVGIGMAFAISLTTAMAVFHLFPLSFTTEPVVLVTGDSYHIVWATDDEGIGSMTYAYGGHDYRVVDATDGYARLSRLHSVAVPRDHLDGNAYTLSVTRVRDVLPYGTVAGETVSQNYVFNAVATDHLTFTVASDYHNRRQDLYAASASLASPDAFIMLGDEMDCLNDLDDVIDYIVTPLGKLTEGKIPVILVRGNHEARGAFSGNLAASLGLDRLYDQVSFGAYRFTILDTGEDKVDGHVEYGPMTDYSAYMAEELTWLEALPASSSMYDITLAHDPTICYGKKTAADDAIAEGYFQQLARLNTGLLIAGHWHEAQIYHYDDGEYPGTLAPAFPAWIDGGIETAGYRISQLTLSGATATLRTIHEDGTPALYEEGNADVLSSFDLTLTMS